jgi:hypothetical protein
MSRKIEVEVAEAPLCGCLPPSGDLLSYFELFQKWNAAQNRCRTSA